MEALFAVGAAVKDVVPCIVLRHRSAGILTRALLHRIESEVIGELLASGKYSRQVLQMVRSADAFGYPKDERPASFDGHGCVPIVFGAIVDAWGAVN